MPFAWTICTLSVITFPIIKMNKSLFLFLSHEQTREYSQLHTVNKLICRIRVARTRLLFNQPLHIRKHHVHFKYEDTAWWEWVWCQLPLVLWAAAEQIRWNSSGFICYPQASPAPAVSFVIILKQHQYVQVNYHQPLITEG